MNDLKTKKKKKKPKKSTDLLPDETGPAAADTVQPSSTDHVVAEDPDADTSELGVLSA